MDDLLEEKTNFILDISPYAAPKEKINWGHSLQVLTQVLGAELGVEEYTQILKSCEYTSGDRHFAEIMVNAYQQINVGGDDTK